MARGPSSVGSYVAVSGDRPSRLAALRVDALAIANSFLDDLDATSIVGDRVFEAVGAEIVDVVAVGKTAREMCAAVRDVGVPIRRQIVVTDERAARRSPADPTVVVGEHPVPGRRSVDAGAALIDFLENGPDSGVTVFLVSGGASSVCCAPAPPVRLSDLVELWRGALAAGLDIGELNAVRTVTSRVSGGVVRRHVRTTRSLGFIAVDNVVSGAAGTGSGLTYDTRGDRDVVARVLDRAGLSGTESAARLLASVGPRNEELARNAPPHENVVVADPSLLLDVARARATSLGYEVVELGAALRGDVRAVADAVAGTIGAAPRGRVCVLGAGEGTVEVVAGGRGGRCQQLAIVLAPLLAAGGRDAAVVARASDGRDHLDDVGGAVVDSVTDAAAHDAGLDLRDAIARCDAYPVLASLGALLPGLVTGWNLCDLVVACIDD